MGFITVTLLFLATLFGGALFTIRILKRNSLRSSYLKSKTVGANASAIKALEKLVQRFPHEIENRLNLVQLHMKDGNFAEAILHLNSILTHGRGQRDFDEKRVHILLGECYEGQENLEEAFEHYAVARKINPQDAAVYGRLGSIQQRRGDLKSAISFLRRAHELDPNNDRVTAEVGTLLFSLKRYDQAGVLLRKARANSPDDARINYQLGEITYRQQDLKTALHHFLKARFDEKYAIKSFFMIARILRKMKNFDGARRALQNGLAIRGVKREQMLALRYELAEVYLAKKDVLGAVEQWELIAAQVASYKDVQEKLSRYEQVRVNASLQSYLTAHSTAFQDLCKQVITNMMSRVTFLRCESLPDSSAEILVQASFRKIPQTVFCKFFRSTSTVGQLAVREFYEKVREIKAKKGLCFINTEFTADAYEFCEGRVLELHDKRTLLEMLSTRRTA